MSEDLKFFFEETTKTVLCEDEDAVGEVAGAGLGFPIHVSSPPQPGTFYVFYRYAVEERMRLFVFAADSQQKAEAIVASIAVQLKESASSGAMGCG